MAAKAAPTKDVSTSTDVKQEASSSPEAMEVKETEVALDETDLKELEAAKAVPYSRFKEINDEKKTLQAQVEKLKANYEDDLRAVRRQAELAAISQREELSASQVEVEPWERQMRTVSQELATTRKELEQVKGDAASIRLNAQLDSLAKKYPEADQLAVLGWKKNQPQADIEELMQMSHNREIEKFQKRYQSLVERKKEKKSVSLPMRDTSVKLKPEDKPKSLRDAGRGLKKILADFGHLK